MKDFLSNSWVVSIISGLLVFFITNTINRKYQKERLYNANKTLLNILSKYVVNNGLLQIEIINAVKSSIAYEYNLKNTELLNTKAIYEGLVKDIIGNIYISNDNRKMYIAMLQNEFEKLDNMEDSNLPSKSSAINSYSSVIASFVAGISTFLMPWILAIVKGTDETFSISITIPLKQTGVATIYTIIFILSVKKIIDNKRKQDKEILKKLDLLPKSELNNIQSPNSN